MSETPSPVSPSPLPNSEQPAASAADTASTNAGGAVAAGTPKQGKWGITLIGIVLMLVGGGFSIWMFQAGKQAMETRDATLWDLLPCTIEMSELEEVREALNSTPTYEVRIRYAYTVDMVSQSSFRVSRRDASRDPRITRTLSDKGKAEELVAKYPMGFQAKCFVNRKNPKQAILEHDTLAPFYVIWFPMLFFVGGLGMILNAWVPHREDRLLKGLK